MVKTLNAGLPKEMLEELNKAKEDWLSAQEKAQELWNQYQLIAKSSQAYNNIGRENTK